MRFNYSFYGLLCVLILTFSSCSNVVQKETETEIVLSSEEELPNKIIVPGLQSILDSNLLEGSILIFNSQKQKYYSNDFEWKEEGELPASTFKIVNSIIALETNVIEDENKIFIWDGKKRQIKTWEQDLTLNEAFRYSCVPCYQELASEIGAIRMKKYLDMLNYNNMDFDSSTVNKFWLEGSSIITQMEQIDFLRRFYNDKLLISKRTKNLVKEMMLLKQTSEYNLYGKTGWSITNDVNNGWFVGFLETEYGPYFFATNIEPKDEFDMELFSVVRKQVTMEALTHFGFIE